MAARARGYNKRDKRELLIYWVAVIAAFFWATQSEAAPWTTYAAPLGFSMEMPDTPVASTTTHRSLFGDITSHLYVAREGRAVFSANVSTLPRWVVRVSGSEMILDRAIDEFLSETQARLDPAWAIGSFGAGHRRVHYTAAAGVVGHVDFVVKDTRLYVFDAALPSWEAPARARRFLASVRFD